MQYKNKAERERGEGDKRKNVSHLPGAVKKESIRLIVHAHIMIGLQKMTQKSYKIF